MPLDGEQLSWPSRPNPGAVHRVVRDVGALAVGGERRSTGPPLTGPAVAGIPNAARSTVSGMVASSVPSASYTVTVWLVDHVLGEHDARPEATTDLGEIAPVMSRTGFIRS